MSRLWPCAQKYLKMALGHTCLVGGMNNKYWLPPSRVKCRHYSLGVTGLRDTLVGRVGCNTDLVGYVLVPVAVCQGVPWLASSSFRRPSLQALTLLRGARFIAWHLRHSFLEECWWGSRRVWAMALSCATICVQIIRVKNSYLKI